MGRVAYLSGGELHLKSPGQPPRVLESAYARDYASRAMELTERNRWKEEGRGAQFMGRGMLWKGDAGALRRSSPRIFGIAGGTAPDQIHYLMRAPGMTGLFCHDASSGEERRLRHGNEFPARDLAARAGDPAFACSLHEDAGSNLGLMDADGGGLRQVTDGDSHDESPAWVPGQSALLYQSAGIGRTAEGLPVAREPYALHRLDLQDGRVVTLLADPACDLLSPRMDEQGVLHYIRRPFETRPAANPLRVAGDFALMPFRLGYAFFKYLDFFSTSYTGKSLTSADDPSRKGADLRQMMIWGNLIDAQTAARERTRAGEDPVALVPGSWRLMRRDPEGRETELARHVLAYDLCRNGGLVYSTGGAVHHLAPDGAREQLCTGAFISQVVALD